MTRLINYLQIALVSLVLFCVSVSALAETMWQYTVRPGDNLITLGERHLINADDWTELQRINRVQDPYRLPIGNNQQRIGRLCK